MADPTCFTVSDRSPIALMVPIRHGRRPPHVGNKGQDTGRWSVGIKHCWLLHDVGWVVAWDWDTMHSTDQRFNRVGERWNGHTSTLADDGVRDHDGVPETKKMGRNGTWHERMGVETALALVTVIGDVKRIRHRVAAYIQARLAFVSAMVTVLMDVLHRIHPDADPSTMRIAEFSL